MNTTSPFNESLLHWLWKNRYLNSENLSTVNSQKLRVFHPGYLNKTDGPDFTNARVQIGPLKWHGDIEIHWSPGDWYHHKHHTDSNYNRVVLHVVFNGRDCIDVNRKDGTEIPTMLMKPFLSKPLQYFFHHYKQPKTLPCAGNLADIPEKVLKEQFRHAHNAYFEQKVNDLLSFYDASLPLSEAWQNMLIVALFDGLGVSHNREPMRKLAETLLTANNCNSSTELTERALKIAGIEPENSDPSFHWKRKGSRPANHPKTRIKQACELLAFIKNRSLSWWLRTAIQESFDTMIEEVQTETAIGSHRGGVLFGTVWLPSYYLLGDLTGTKRLTEHAKKHWLNHRTRLPASVKKPFEHTHISPEIYRRKLGTVHQLRAYCKPHRCQQCKVFNFIISS